MSNQPKLGKPGGAKEMRMVRVVKPHLMDGDTKLEKQLNAYLTARFVLSKNVPSDECLKEAREIIRMVQESSNNYPIGLEEPTNVNQPAEPEYVSLPEYESNEER